MTAAKFLLAIALVSSLGCGGSAPATPADRAEAVEQELQKVERELLLARSARSTAARKLSDPSLAALHPSLERIVARKTALVDELESRIEELRGELDRPRGGVAGGERPRR